MKFKPESIAKDIVEALNNLNSVLLQTGKNYQTSDAIANAVISFSRTAVYPVAFILLILFLYMSFGKAQDKLSTSMVSSPSSTFNVIMWTIFKMAFGVFLVQNLSTMLFAIIEASDRVVEAALASSIGGGGTAIPIPDVITLADEIKASKVSLKITDFMLTSIQLWAAGLASWVAKLCVDMVLLSRTLSIYTLIALAPIPAVFIVNEDWSHVAKSFIRSFAAVAATSSVVVIGLKVFVIVASTIPMNATTVSDYSGNILLMSILQITFIIGAAGLSKKLFSAM